VLNKFGFKAFEVCLSTRPEDSIGSDEVWEQAEKALSDALQKKAWPVEVDEGGGAFYGPKIDIKIKVTGRFLLSASKAAMPCSQRS
jgi:threonyl-tRNA synthetase